MMTPLLQTLSRRHRHCRHPAYLCVISLLYLIIISLLPSTSLAVTSPADVIRRPQQQQRQQQQQPARSGRRPMTSDDAPRRRPPAPLDCSEGLQRCREDLTCRTLLDTLDNVCDQSSTYTFFSDHILTILSTKIKIRFFADYFSRK